MRRLIWTLVALVAAGVLFFVYVVPPGADVSTLGVVRPRRADGRRAPTTSTRTRSDGHGDKPAVAAAAARAGLKFVILTDHGDGTRPPDSAGIHRRRALPRRGRDQHRRGPLRRARHAARAVSARRRGGRRRRRRARLGGFGDRRAPGFAEAGAALDRRDARSTASSG